MATDRLPVFDRRRAGVLLPMSALAGALGRGGRAFIDWLALAGFSVWQILPAGPVGPGGSPYWVRSDFAGNPDFLDPAELPDPNAPPSAEFLSASAPWLFDYVLFEALTRARGGAPFWHWPARLRDRDPGALAAARRRLSAEAGAIEREQYAFYVQWQRLREHARARGVRLFGDLPFYVGPSSADTWVHRDLFELTPSGEPAAVGGVPRITSPSSASYGATRCTTGWRSSAPTSAGGGHACARSSSGSICCASITSAHWPPTGRCRRVPPTRAAVAG